MTEQLGYDALAQLYADTFPSAYLTALEAHAVHAFSGLVDESAIPGVLVDVGCGLGHVTADLAHRGLDVVGVEPSESLLRIAHSNHPECQFLRDDARLSGAAVDVQVAAVLARFSIIHIHPDDVAAVFAAWAARMATGSVVLVACQSSDESGVFEFDHRVARAWRWSPDALAAGLQEAGFDELWRTCSRPAVNQRFPEVHLVARRR